MRSLFLFNRDKNARMRHARDAEGGYEHVEKAAGFFGKLIPSLSGSENGSGG